MTSSHGRRIQSRRALAILAWATLVVVAGMLWYGQQKRIIRIQAWEPAALVLSAYATFLAIFGWLLFSPGRKSAEESPGLFFSGMLTLLPPCFIAYNLMPVGSPLRPWMTIGVFLFGVLAIMSPLPEEVFAVPRDRRTYLHPLTDAYLSELNVDAPEVSFESVAPRNAYWLSRQPLEPEPTPASGPKDPWSDPFYGTGRQMSRIGVSQSRRNEEASRLERRRSSDESTTPGLAGRDTGPLQNLPIPLPARRPMDADERVPTDPRTVTFKSPPPVPQMPYSAFRPTEPRPAETPPRIPVSNPNPLSASSRRPLTEPSQRASNPVGFQTPIPQRSSPTPASPPTSASQLTPPPLPASAFSKLDSSRIATPAHATQSITATGLNLAPPNKPIPAVSVTPVRDILSGAASAAALSQLSAPPTAPKLPVVSRVPETSRPSTPPTVSSASTRPLFDPTTPAVKPTTRTPELSLRELDDQLRRQQDQLVDEGDTTTEADERFLDAASRLPVAGVTQSGQQTSGDVSMERIRDEQGGEMIEGTIKVHFEVGQKRAHLHVPFSPPLQGLPEVECEPTDDDSIRLKVAVRQPYGIRIEARRSDASQTLETEIGFAAVYTPSARHS